MTLIMIVTVLMEVLMTVLVLYQPPLHPCIPFITTITPLNDSDSVISIKPNHGQQRWSLYCCSWHHLQCSVQHIEVEHNS